jgi:hypothetical protein
MSSDFGSGVSIYRADRQPTRPEDDRRIRAAARSLQFRERDRIGLFDHLDLGFGGARRRDGVWGVSVMLTGHFIGDHEGNDRLDPEALIERELPVAEQFAEELAGFLGEEYEVVPYSGYW